MELRDYLNSEGAGKLNIIAVNWGEDTSGEPGPRMQRFIDIIHPDIPIVAGTERTGRDLGVTGYVPISFIFDSNGKLVAGDGRRSPVHIDDLKRILARIS